LFGVLFNGRLASSLLSVGSFSFFKFRNTTDYVIGALFLGYLVIGAVTLLLIYRDLSGRTKAKTSSNTKSNASNTTAPTGLEGSNRRGITYPSPTALAAKLIPTKFFALSLSYLKSTLLIANVILPMRLMKLIAPNETINKKKYEWGVKNGTWTSKLFLAWRIS
jgi:hypothetical protein